MAEPKLRFPVRKLAALRPGYLALLFVVLALVLGAFALYGLRQAQQSTLETLERGARSLAEAVSRAEENVLRAEGDMEDLVGERLLDNARLLAELGSAQALSDTLLARITADNTLDQADVLDAGGVEWRRRCGGAGGVAAGVGAATDRCIPCATSTRAPRGTRLGASSRRLWSGRPRRSSRKSSLLAAAGARFCRCG